MRASESEKNRKISERSPNQSRNTGSAKALEIRARPRNQRRDEPSEKGIKPPRILDDRQYPGEILKFE
jgi:hypothetical protein